MKKLLSIILCLVIGFTLCSGLQVSSYTPDVESLSIGQINSGQVAVNEENYYEFNLDSTASFIIDYDATFEDRTWMQFSHIKIIKRIDLDDYLIGKEVPFIYKVTSKSSNEINYWYDGTITLNKGNYIMIIQNTTNGQAFPTDYLMNYTLLLRKTRIKLSQNIVLKTHLKTIKYNKIKRKKQTVKLLTVKNANGKITVTKEKRGTTSSIYKKVRVNKSTGKITLKKGNYTKKTYKIRLKIKASGNSNYKAASKKVTVKLRIK